MCYLGRGLSNMKDDPIPEKDHIARYVGGSKIIGDRVSGAAFQLRPDESALSVNWLEYLQQPDHESAIKALRRVFVKKGWKLQAKAKFAALNVGKTRNYVHDESEDRRKLDILHDPLPNDESHTGIHNLRIDDDIIGDIIAELIEEEGVTYPAQEPPNS